MIALIRMRLVGFLRTGRVIAPLLAGLAVILTLYGGGQPAAGEAYGLSAVVIFPVLAWQTKLLLDAEPDTQRRLALVALGSRGRELVAGLVAATACAVPMVVLALALPWLTGGVTAAGGVGPALAIGLWAHALAVPPAVVLGALSSRVVTRSPGRGIAVLVGGAVLAIVLGLRTSPLRWLVPPLMSTARALATGAGSGTVAQLTGWAALWTGVTLSVYWLIRRSRA